MKKILLLVLTLVFTIALTACGNAGSQEQQGPSGDRNAEAAVADNNTKKSAGKQQGELTDAQGNPGGRILVAYFSRTGENYNVGYIEKGNTHIIADMIAEQTGGDTFKISTVTPYPDEYKKCTDIAQQERKENARPKLANKLENLDDYDVIFLGYPIWWGDMPMAVYTFLESYNFAGKTILPFSTNEGSGLGSTVKNIAEICPEAKVVDGLSIRGTVAQNSQEEAAEAVTKWLRQIVFFQ